MDADGTDALRGRARRVPLPIADGDAEAPAQDDAFRESVEDLVEMADEEDLPASVSSDEVPTSTQRALYKVSAFGFALDQFVLCGMWV